MMELLRLWGLLEMDQMRFELLDGHEPLGAGVQCYSLDLKCSPQSPWFHCWPVALKGAVESLGDGDLWKEVRSPRS